MKQLVRWGGCEIAHDTYPPARPLYDKPVMMTPGDEAIVRQRTFLHKLFGLAEQTLQWQFTGYARNMQTHTMCFFVYFSPDELFMHVNICVCLRTHACKCAAARTCTHS